MRQVCDFLPSIESAIRVTSLAINEYCVKNAMRYDVDMERDRKVWTREIHRKTLNKEFHFTETSLE